jgi:hypothetical protein
MASKRHKRRNQCDGKLTHSSLDFAFAHVDRLRKRGFNVRPYKCNYCGSWHVGHPRRALVGAGR